MSNSMRNTLNYRAIGAHCLMFIAPENDAIKIKAG
jgi:hypothetical protein